jgi:transposase
MDPMTKEDCDIQRKLKVLRHAEKTGRVARTCRYFCVGRSSFYRWKAAYDQNGEAGLINAKPIPKNPANQTPPEIVDKVLYLRSKYHLGSIRIVWYLARYHDIKISDAGVTRILRRNRVGRLPHGTRMRKVRTKRYNKQVLGHHIQMDVKFLTFIGKRGEKIRQFQYTATDDATSVRALKVFDNTHKPTRSTSSIISSKSSHSASAKYAQTMATSSRPSSTGMSRITAFATPTSSVVPAASSLCSSLAAKTASQARLPPLTSRLCCKCEGNVDASGRGDWCGPDGRGDRANYRAARR